MAIKGWGLLHSLRSKFYQFKTLHCTPLNPSIQGGERTHLLTYTPYTVTIYNPHSHSNFLKIFEKIGMIPLILGTLWFLAFSQNSVFTLQIIIQFYSYFFLLRTSWNIFLLQFPYKISNSDSNFDLNIENPFNLFKFY